MLPKQHKVKIIKKKKEWKWPQPHPSINITDCTHYATLICKLEQVLWSECFTDPVIKLIFLKTSGRAAEVVNRFSHCLRILMGLYQFWIHHRQEMEGRVCDGATSSVAGHPALQSQGHPSPKQHQGNQDLYIILLPCCRNLSEASHQDVTMPFCSDSNRWSHTAAQCCSLWGAALSNQYISWWC